MKHVIFFDNGQDYEDNHQYALCIAPDGKSAAAEVKRLTDWFAGMKERFPLIFGGTMEQGDWLAAEDARRAKVNRIRCPYGCGDIREGIQYCRGRFYASAVPDVKTPSCPREDSLA